MASLRQLYEMVSGGSQVCCDMQLFIRLLEWAREESTDDLQIHRLAENAKALSSKNGELTMEHYEQLVSGIGEQLGMYTGLTEPVDFDQNDGGERAAKMGSRKPRT